MNAQRERARTHVLPYEGPLHMAAEMLSRMEDPEEIEVVEFQWCVHSIRPHGANLWRFHMEPVRETRTRDLP